MYKFVLYYEKKASYQDRMERIVEALEKVQNKWKVGFTIVDVEALLPSQVEQVKKDIRSIQPQVRGKIVSAKNKVLPFSKSKNLNTKNTSILVLYYREEPINVYPHMFGTTYFEIEPQLEAILDKGLEVLMSARGLLEEPMQKILADDPAILEEGMCFKDVNKDVRFGVADIILQDAEGTIAVVEIETKAAETAVAQVSRLAAGYTLQNSLSMDNVRKIIFCQHFDERTVKACRGANVELYRLTTEKVC